MPRLDDKDAAFQHPAFYDHQHYLWSELLKVYKDYLGQLPKDTEVDFNYHVRELARWQRSCLDISEHMTAEKVQRQEKKVSDLRKCANDPGSRQLKKAHSRLKSNLLTLRADRASADIDEKLIDAFFTGVIYHLETERPESRVAALTDTSGPPGVLVALHLTSLLQDGGLVSADSDSVEAALTAVSAGKSTAGLNSPSKPLPSPLGMSESAARSKDMQQDQAR